MSGSPASIKDRVKDFYFRNGSVRLHAVEAGPEDGPVVCLLHGFPEFWFGWRHQIGALADAGFRVIAPDGRGYNLSDKPASIGAYTIPNLVSDVFTLCDYLGQESVYLAGHDWGAVVAWAFAAAHPDRVKRLAILNVPHPAVMPRFLPSHPTQWLRSWYIAFFQIPRLPELLFPGTLALKATSRPGTFSGHELAEYRKAWAHPGALTGMINWYRALLRHPSTMRIGVIDPPVLIQWGMRDAFLHPELADRSLVYCSRAHLIRLQNATHWLQHEEPARINDNLIAFFRLNTPRAIP